MVSVEDLIVSSLVGVVYRYIRRRAVWEKMILLKPGPVQGLTFEAACQKLPFLPGDVLLSSYSLCWKKRVEEKCGGSGLD